MAFKLLVAMEKRWRKVNAPHLVVLVTLGVEFPNGQAEMLRSEPEPDDLFMPTPRILTADELLVHNI
jgi:hypothetical protein